MSDNFITSIICLPKKFLQSLPDQYELSTEEYDELIKKHENMKLEHHDTNEYEENNDEDDSSSENDDMNDNDNDSIESESESESEEQKSNMNVNEEDTNTATIRRQQED